MTKGVTLNTGLKVKTGLLVLSLPIKISPHPATGENTSKAAYVRAIASSWQSAVRLSPALDPSWGEGKTGLNLIVRCGVSESDARVGLKMALRALKPPSASAVRSEIAALGGRVCAISVYEARQAADSACASLSVRVLSRFKSKSGQVDKFSALLDKYLNWKDITAKKPEGKDSEEPGVVWEEKKIASPLAQACAMMAARRLSPSTVSTREGLISPIPLNLNKAKVMSLLAMLARAAKNPRKSDEVACALYRTGALGASQKFPDSAELLAAIREAASSLAK